MGVIKIDFDSSTCWQPVRTTSFVEDAIILLFYIFCFFVKNQVLIGVWIYNWIFNLTPLINLFLCQYHAYCYYYYYCVVSLKSGMVIALDVPLLCRTVLSIPGFFFLHMKLSTVLLRSVKICVDIVMGITLNL